MRVTGHKWLVRRMGAGYRYFCGFALGWNECGSERRGRKGNTGANAEGAEVAQKSQKEYQNCLENGLNPCLCGLQGINGWEGAWGLVIVVFAVWLCVGWNECGGERRRRRSYAKVAEEMPNYLKSEANSIRLLFPRQARNPSFPRRRESMPVTYSSHHSVIFVLVVIPGFISSSSPLSSFPRRRESMSALLVALDSRLRGNDGFWGLRSCMKNKSALR